MRNSRYFYITFHGKPIEDLCHLARYVDCRLGLGPIVCGIDRHAKESGGWSWHPTKRNPFGKVTPVCGECVSLALEEREADDE